MNPDVDKKDSVSDFEPDLELDEDIEIDLDTMKQQKAILDNAHQPSKEIAMERSTLRKPTLAGILLIIAFILNLLFPVYYLITIQDVQNSSGETNLIGQIKDIDGNPVDNVTVEISETNFTTTTSKDGKYTFDDIPVGEYKITFSKPGYRKIVVKKTLFTQQFLSQGGIDANEINIPGNLSSGLQIGEFEGPFYDTLVYEQNFNHTLYGTITNSSGINLSNANVHIYVLDYAQNPVIDFNTNTDESGSYRISNLPPGVINIQVSIPNHENTNSHKILMASNTSMRYDIQYIDNMTIIVDEISTGTGNISGTIHDKTDEALSEVKVLLVPASDIYNESKSSVVLENKTDENGNFFFFNVPLGIFDLKIIRQDYFLFDIKNITITNNSKIELSNIELEKLEEPLIIEEEILNEYTILCISILFLLTFLTLIGGISALQRKHYSLAFIGACTGILPVFLALNQANICGASILSSLAVVLLVFSREDFRFKKRKRNAPR